MSNIIFVFCTQIQAAPEWPLWPLRSGSCLPLQTYGPSLPLHFQSVLAFQSPEHTKPFTIFGLVAYPHSIVWLIPRST